MALLISNIEEFLADASSTTAVWIDLLSVNQHDETKEHCADIAAFGDVIDACSHGTLVVMVGLQPCVNGNPCAFFYFFGSSLAMVGNRSTVYLARGLSIHKHSQMPACLI